MKARNFPATGRAPYQPASLGPVSALASGKGKGYPINADIKRYGTGPRMSDAVAFNKVLYLARAVWS